MKILFKIFEFPFKLCALALIKFYKVAVSPWLPNACRFQPTCSTYAMIAIKEHGVVKGIVLAFKRILRCNPKSKTFGTDPVPPNIKGDIKWLI